MGRACPGLGANFLEGGSWRDLPRQLPICLPWAGRGLSRGARWGRYRVCPDLIRGRELRNGRVRKSRGQRISLTDFNQGFPAFGPSLPLPKGHSRITLVEQERCIGAIAGAGPHLRLPALPEPVKPTDYRAIVIAALRFQSEDAEQPFGPIRRV